MRTIYQGIAGAVGAETRTGRVFDGGVARGLTIGNWMNRLGNFCLA